MPVKNQASLRKLPLREQILTWFVCGIIVLSFLISYGLLLRNVSSTVKDTEHLLNVQADTIADEISSSLNSYRMLGEILAANREVLQFASYSGHESMELLTPESYSLSRALSVQISVYGNDINSIALYFIKSGWVITMARQLEPEHSNLYFDGYPTLSPEYLQSASYPEHWNFHFPDEADPHSWVIRQVTQGGMVVGYVIVDYNLKNLVDRFSVANSQTVLGSEAGLYYSSDPAITEKNYNALLSTAREENCFQLQGIRYNTALISTMFPDVQVLSGVPTDRLVQEQTVFTLIAISSFVIIVLCISIMVIFLNQRLFRPVDHLIQKTNRHHADAVSALKQIGDDYVTLQNANKRYIQEQNNVIPLALGRQLSHIPEGAFDDPSVLMYAQSALLLAGLQPGDGFALFAVCCVEDRKDFFRQIAGDPHLEKKVGAFHFVLNNVLTDLLFPDYPGVVAPLQNEWYCVLVTCSSATDAEQIKSIIPTLMNSYEEAFSASLLCTDVSWGNSPESFSLCVRSINKEITFLDFWGSRAEDSEEDFDSFRNYRIATKKLYARLATQDYPGVSAILEDLFTQAHSAGVENMSITKSRIYSLSIIILTYIDEQFGEGKFPMMQEYEERLLHAESALDIKRELHALLDDLDAVLKSQKNVTSTAGRIPEVQNYIEEHFTENDFTAAAIAEHFNMNSSYLSRAFKEYSGMNILEYIQRLRIARAKELLETQRVKDVALAVGFWDTQGLVRAFKKIEGITPSEYKELHKQQ